MKYICTEAFSVEMYDDDGRSTDRYLDIEVGDEYETDDSPFRVAGGPDTIRLESKNGNWLELLQSTIDKYFAPAEESLRCNPCKPTQPECGACEWAEEAK